MKIKSKEMFAIYAKITAQADKNTSGRAGEYFTEVFLKKQGIKYEKWPQEILPLSSTMAELGGKRPDFVALLDQNILIIDAKYHKTENCTKFYLSDEEIKKYKGMIGFFRKEYANLTNLVFTFFLFPKEDLGKSFYLILMDDFDSWEEVMKYGKKGRFFDLNGQQKIDCILFQEDNDQ